MNKKTQLHLSHLKQGFPGVSPALGMAHLEACLVCLTDQKHTSGVTLFFRDESNNEIELLWDEPVTLQMLRSWNDEEIATEWGAYGIAFLLITELTEYTIIRKSRKGTGFDYWLGHNEDAPLFQDKARLEVSGIRKADKESSIKARLSEKVIRLVSKKNMLPAYVIVVEFSRPLAYMVTK